MVIYGWNEEGFKFQNSWGPLWGNGGRAILPYEIKVREAWSVTDNIIEGNLDIKKPFHSELGNVIAKIVATVAVGYIIGAYYFLLLVCRFMKSIMKM